MLEHGGDMNVAVAQYGIPLADWLNLSTGINPVGYPVPPIPDALWQRLPLEVDGLIEAARQYYGTPDVLPTAGSQAAIQILPSLISGANVLLLTPMYAEHACAWRRHGHHVSEITHLPNATDLAEVDVMVVCNPNNPTGRMIPNQTLLSWHTQLTKKGGWLIVDEAFMDATPENSLAKHTHLPGLILLRSLGKFFGLAGTRVGFVLAEQTLLNTLKERLGPWPISGPARYVAVKALSDADWQASARKGLIADSLRLHDLLASYGLVPAGNTALFQWVPSPRAQEIHTLFAKNGVWLRHFATQSALRFGLPSAQGWEKLERVLAGLTQPKT
ncbi:MAG: threonine-phosphate decarboxylase CobD [Methylophilaceae bacterium]